MTRDSRDGKRQQRHTKSRNNIFSCHQNLLFFTTSILISHSYQITFIDLPPPHQTLLLPTSPTPPPPSPPPHHDGIFSNIRPPDPPTKTNANLQRHPRHILRPYRHQHLRMGSYAHDLRRLQVLRRYGPYIHTHIKLGP